MITWIKDTAKSYKQNSIHNTFEIKDVHDMEKVDSKFYQDMKLHKAKRLEHRESYVHKVTVRNNSYQQSARDQKLRRKDSNSKSKNSLSEVSANQ